jgi:hypothetical protein
MPSTLGRSLANYKGPEMITVFSAGCCGDANHIDVNWVEEQRGFGNAARMGTILAAEVLRSWPCLKPVEADKLQVKNIAVRLGLVGLGDGDVDHARAIIKRVEEPKAKRPCFLETVWAFKVLYLAVQHGRPLEVEVQVISLGNGVAWVLLPGEVFTDLGLAIKQDSRFSQSVSSNSLN